MLKKAHRLSKKEFDVAWNTGRRYQSPYLTIVVAPSETFQAAAVVGKKVAKLAVDRNRLRRQVYGALERTIPLHTYQGAILVITKPPFATLPVRERRVVVENELKKLL